MLHVFHPGTSPALLLLHGTGGDENDLIPIGQILRPGAALLSPRGQVLENGQPRFFRRLAPGVFDEDDLIRRTHELADFVEDQSARQHLGNIIAVGYSNGANIATSLLLLRPGLLSGAVLFRAMVPLEPAQPPQLGGVTVLLLAGRRDAMIAQDSTQRLAALLSQAGAKLSLVWRDSGHELTGEDFTLARDWLARDFPA
ncbi:MAG: alpha/beta hydrolase [Chthoniobacterales bacterium]|nr:alpha/beta hydrolase [Chthoniobacterales bacterium]